MSHSVLNGREARLLIRYLDGVDELVGRRIAASHRLDEDSLTSVLSEMLDEQLGELHALPFAYEALKKELAEDPRQLTASIRIESTTYSKHVERHRTSADLGVIVTYRNWLDGSQFERGALFQAKRVYPSAALEFDLESEFKAFDWDQFLRLATLLPPSSELKPGEVSGGRLPASSFAAYLLYMPRPEGFTPRAMQSIHNWIAGNAHHWDRHPHMQEMIDGGALHALELSSDPHRYVPSLVTTRLDWLVEEHLVAVGPDAVELAPGKRLKPTVSDVWERYFHYRGSLSLSWRLVYDMLCGRFGSEDEDVLDLVRGEPSTPTLAPFLPKYVLSLSIETGVSSDLQASRQ